MEMKGKGARRRRSAEGEEEDGGEDEGKAKEAKEQKHLRTHDLRHVFKRGHP